MAHIHNEELIEFVEAMPAFPKSVQKILQLTSDVNASAKEIVAVIESDPIMTVKILKVINSAFYGLPQKITSIQRAVIHIGLNTIKNLALSVAAIGVLKPKNKAGFSTQDFLLHSLTTATLCRTLAESVDVDPSESSDFFVAGLLHDFGKIVFAEFDPVNFRQALEKSVEENIPLHKVETELMGMNHAQAGKILAEKWNLDPVLIDAIDHHHYADAKNKTLLKDCLFTANQISKKLQFGFAGNPVIEETPGEIISRFELTLEDLIASLGDLDQIKSEALSLINS
ncbi:MAG: HDOD domain-containing protein [Methylococcaceae bacterium]|nr:HDOD domain-containing protein [Methylococcaceae bacterium]